MIESITVHRSTKNRSIYVYSTQKSFSVILILVLTFTVVIFGQIQCKEKLTFIVLYHFQSSYKVVFGRLCSVKLTILLLTSDCLKWFCLDYS